VPNWKKPEIGVANIKGMIADGDHAL